MKDAPWRKEWRYSYEKVDYTAFLPFDFQKKQTRDHLFFRITRMLFQINYLLIEYIA